jgi:hypothetical protein
MPDEEYKIEYAINVEGADDLRNAREEAEGLREEVAALQEEPLTLGVEGELPKPPRKKEEEDGGQRASKKRKRQEDKEAEERFSAMVSSGLVRGFRSRDVKAELAELGQQLAATAATTLLSKGIGAALSAIPGLGVLTSFLGFRREGLVTKPTLALVGEREPEFVVTQERMRALLSGGRLGYGFGPGDFGLAPNVNVAAPQVNVEVTMNPGVDADIETAYRCRRGEVLLSQLEG